MLFDNSALQNFNRFDIPDLPEIKSMVDSLSEFAEDNSADAEESDSDKDVGGDARLQPWGSNHLQHGSSVNYTLR